MPEYQGRTPLPEPMTLKEMLEFYRDALKVLGTGNVTGVIGAAAALHYFAANTLVIGYVKASALAFLLGVVAFSISYLLLALATLNVDDVIRIAASAIAESSRIQLQNPEVHKLRRVSESKVRAASISAGISTVCFFVGIAITFVALISM